MEYNFPYDESMHAYNPTSPNYNGPDEALMKEQSIDDFVLDHEAVTEQFVENDEVVSAVVSLMIEARSARDIERLDKLAELMIVFEDFLGETIVI